MEKEKLTKYWWEIKLSKEINLDKGILFMGQRDPYGTIGIPSPPPFSKSQK